MPGFKVAHIYEQGVNLIVIPLDHHFGNKPESEQLSVVEELQLHSNHAGLRGTVVPVWNDGGRMQFRAPHRMHPFFETLHPDVIEANLNKEIFW